MAMKSANVIIRYYDSIQQTNVEWLWYPYIPLGKVTVIQGDPGDGKTTLALHIAALVSVGGVMPVCDHAPLFGNVIYQSSEDNVADTIKPRLISAGADCSRIAFIDKENFDISTDHALLENLIRESNIKLLVLDPLQAYIGKNADLCRAVDMRRLMGGLTNIASKANCAVVTIGHMNKASGTKSLYRGLGSIDITASARSVLLVSRADDNHEIRVMRQIKNSLAPEGRPVAFEINGSSSVRFLGEYRGLMADNECNEDNTPADSKREIAADKLLEMLSQHPYRCSEVYESLAVLGVSERTANRVKKDLGICSVRKLDGWYWSLNGGQSE